MIKKGLCVFPIKIASSFQGKHEKTETLGLPVQVGTLK